jgi:hypothetical protein
MIRRQTWNKRLALLLFVMAVAVLAALPASAAKEVRLSSTIGPSTRAS